MKADTKKLEFHKILQKLKGYAQTDLGKKQILEISPQIDQINIQRLLNEVEEAKIMIQRFDETPMTGVLDLTEIIKKARINSVLTIDEFLRVVSHQEAVSRSLIYFKKIISLEISAIHLSDYYSRLVSVPALKQAIESVIDKKGEIYDNASSKLAMIRKKIRVGEERINTKMSQLLRSEQSKLTDSLITIRNNRLVLPVKSEYKNSFKGIIHDLSSSGETVFIEPISCVDLNNDLQRYFIEENTEIDIILRALTEKVNEYGYDLESNLEILTYLDIVFAKAKYALAENFTKPQITKSTINLINARHPLIPLDVVVGNDINFKDYNHIIITGPNTGGKTVALKTLGLISIMVQSGLLAPVDEGSKTIIFKGIYADIGDEQSIEQSLSTFSSHIENIIRILKDAKEDALVLLDEIGSGTDPKEGASLAISIIDFLRKKQLYSMVTTHYPELKTYAYDLDNTINASVEFDIETLKPTYRLKIGVPGTSNAIQIARRLGLDKDLCDNAENVSLSFDTDVSKLIAKLEKQSMELEDLNSLNKEKAIILDHKSKELDELKKQEKIRQNKLIETYEEQLKSRQADYLKKAKDLIDELDQLKKNAESFKEHELAKLKHDVKKTFFHDVEYKKSSDKEISIGDTVKVLSYQRNALVNKELKNGEFEVQMGTLTLNVKKTEIEFVSNESNEMSYQKKPVDTQIRSVKVELDLLGKRYEEAMIELDKFVDDCLLNNLEYAYIVHGIGTGALRKGVEKYAKENAQVKAYRRGNENEGGVGVTVYLFR